MRTVVALFDRLDDARMALQDLRDAGIRNDEINLLARDASGDYTRQLGKSTLDQGADEASEGAATGAGIGAVLGGLGGLLLGLGALAIPGVGPVIAAGPIVATLAGAGVGAVAGGLVGGLVDMGVPEEHAQYYAEGVRRGGTLVTARVADDQAEMVRDVLNRHNPVDIENSVRTWREGNWTAFDEGAEPLDYEHMEFNRTSTTSTMPVTGGMLDDDDSFNQRDFNKAGSTYTQDTHLEHDNTELDRERDLYDRQTRQHSVPVTGGDIDRTGKIDDDLQANNTSMDLEGDIYGGKSTSGDIPVTGGRMDDSSSLMEDEDMRMDDSSRIHDRSFDRADIPVTGGTMDDSDSLLDDDVDDLRSRDDRSTFDRPYDQTDIPVTGGISGMGTRQDMGTMHDMGTMSDYDDAFRTDYLSRYSTTGRQYEYYQPAYRFGYDMAMDDRYHGYDWNRAEPELRRQWTNRGEQSTWDDVKDAIRHGWDSITGRR